MRYKPLTVAAAAVVALVCAQPAMSLPVFAHRYGLSCEVCHTAIPHLTSFGEAFLADGFRLPPSLPQGDAFPVAIKVNLAYSSATDPSGLPKSIVDELELLAGAPVNKHLSYRLEQYVVDGGVPGRTRDAWLSYTSKPTFGDPAPALQITAGEFTLPLPDDPETQRDTENHYAVFDQTIGANPFDLFDDKSGIDVSYGSPYAGTAAHADALIGHDAGSGLPTHGIDSMLTVRTGSPFAYISVYRYQGSRPIGPISDHFARQGYGLNASSGDASFDAVLQHGEDASADGRGASIASSGGFLQLRWTASPRMFGVLRFDATSDAVSGSRRSVTASLIFKPYKNSRLTLEDVVEDGRHSPGAAWLIAY